MSVTTLALREKSDETDAAAAAAVEAANKAMHAFNTAKIEREALLDKRQIISAKNEDLTAELTQLEEQKINAQAVLETMLERKAGLQTAVTLIETGETLKTVDASLTQLPNPSDAASVLLTATQSKGNAKRNSFEAVSSLKQKLSAVSLSLPKAGSFKSSDESLGDENQLARLSSKVRSLASTDAGFDSSADLRRALVASAAAIAFVGVIGFGISRLTLATALLPPVETTSVKAPVTETTVDLQAFKARSSDPELGPDPVPDPMLDIKSASAQLPTILLPEIPAPVGATSVVNTPRLETRAGDAGEEASVDAVEEASVDAAVEIDEAVMTSPINITVPYAPNVNPASFSFEREKPVEIKTKVAAITSIDDETNTQATLKAEREALDAKRALTKTAQTQLSQLGFYDGNLDGLTGDATYAAVIEFKTLFGLPKNTALSIEFMDALKTASAQVKTLESRGQTAELVKIAEPVDIQVGRVAPLESTPVESSPVESTPVYVAPVQAPVKPVVIAAPKIEPVKTVPMPVQSASIKPIIAPTPKAPDTIVDAKRLNAITADYPRVPSRRSYTKTVRVTLTYDIAQDGTVINASVRDISDVDGRYRDDFEQEGLKAIRAQKFSPRTVNAKPVVSKGHSARIEFQS